MRWPTCHLPPKSHCEPECHNWCSSWYWLLFVLLEDDDDEDHDNLEPISADNIIQGGRRTRGKQIDFAEAAEKSREAGDDEMEDDEDDEDFSADEDDEMRD